MVSSGSIKIGGDYTEYRRTARVRPVGTKRNASNESAYQHLPHLPIFLPPFWQGRSLTQVHSLEIADVKIVQPVKHGDHRGFFSETYNRRVLAEHGIDVEFVQDNHSYSAAVGTLRGLHFQIPPSAQGKLVRVISGRIFDVAVDIRQGSATYGRWVSAEISADAWDQIWVPAGFAHGFLTLEPDTEVIYKVTGYYDPACDKGIAWNDPQIGIRWPLSDDRIILSAKDEAQPAFSELPDYFSNEQGG